MGRKITLVEHVADVLNMRSVGCILRLYQGIIFPNNEILNAFGQRSSKIRCMHSSSLVIDRVDMLSEGTYNKWNIEMLTVEFQDLTGL